MTQLKDSEFKKLVSKLNANSWADTRFRPDLAKLSEDSLLVVEYENSSRGCVNHVAKWSRAAELLQTRIELLVIRTRYHQENHNADFLNAQHLLDTLQKRETFQGKIVPSPASEAALLRLVNTFLSKAS